MSLSHATAVPDKVIEESGVGTFGRVLLCEDTHHAGRRVAMKVVRAIKKYSSSARLEAEILRKVNRRDKDGRSRIVTLFDTFEWDGHVCMVFEALGKSLYDYVKMNHYKPLPLRCVQTFSEQLLQSIAFLHSMKLVHTDLKPENVLLMPTSFRKVTAATMKRDRRRVLEPFEKTIKCQCAGGVLSVPSLRLTICCCSPVIDFGGATFESDHHSTIVNTRQYRAPEVILQLGWGPPSDIWSAACIIMELYVGELLFSTVRCAHLPSSPRQGGGSRVPAAVCLQHDNREHLALMQRVLGPIPSHMIQRARGPARDFFQRGELVWPGRKTAYDRIEAVKKTLPLEVRTGGGSAARLSVRDPIVHAQQIIHPHDDIFVDFMRGLLTFDPRKRLTAEQALKHRFFNPPKSSAPRVSTAAKRKAPAAKAVKPSVADSVGAGGGAGSSGHGDPRPRKTTIGSAVNGNGNGHASGSRSGTAKR